MPCSRRMHHGGGHRCHRFHRFHPYAGVHPGFHPCFTMMMNEAVFAAEEEEATSPFKTSRHTRWGETDASYTLQMDVPGVKPHQVTIEEKDGEIEITAIRMKGEDIAKTHQEVLYVRPSKADLANIVATLNEGVLTVAVPKKIQEPFAIDVESGSAPSAALEGKEFRASFDLPGVKAKDLRVEFREDKVYIEAARTIGPRTINVRRIIEVEPVTANMNEARVFLQAGVFTLVAPIPEQDDEVSKPSALRTILVQEDIAALEALTLEDGAVTNDADMMVETVTEEEEKDWEQVKEGAMEQATDKTD